MDTFQIFKVVGAVLAALLLILGTQVLIDFTIGERAGVGDKMVVGYTLEEDSDEDAGAAAAPTVAADKPAQTAVPATAPAAAPAESAGSAPALASSSGVVAMVSEFGAEDGKKPFKKCMGCHNSEEGKGAKAGPNLWGIVGRAKAGVEGFSYSDAMKGKGGTWTLDDLAAFLRKPKAFIPKTKMVFKGFKKDKDIAKILAYLSSLK